VGPKSSSVEPRLEPTEAEARPGLERARRAVGTSGGEGRGREGRHKSREGERHLRD